MSTVRDEINLLSVIGDQRIGNAMKRTRITRITPADYFLAMINTSRNVLSRVLKWQDVYECYAVRLKIKNTHARNLLRDYYGQCWSFRTEESELFWNARNLVSTSDKHDVVMIETTVYDLVKSISDIELKTGYAQGFVRICAVDYSLPKVITPDQVAQDLSSDVNLTDTLFRKRPQFSDEKELRVVFNLRGNAPHRFADYKNHRSLISYAVSNTAMIRRVVCHPLMTKRRFNAVKKAILHSTWAIPSVTQSDLYELPKRTFNIF